MKKIFGKLNNMIPSVFFFCFFSFLQQAHTAYWNYNRFIGYRDQISANACNTLKMLNSTVASDPLTEVAIASSVPVLVAGITEPTPFVKAAAMMAAKESKLVAKKIAQVLPQLIRPIVDFGENKVFNQVFWDKKVADRLASQIRLQAAQAKFDDIVLDQVVTIAIRDKGHYEASLVKARYFAQKIEKSFGHELAHDIAVKLSRTTDELDKIVFSALKEGTNITKMPYDEIAEKIGVQIARSEMITGLPSFRRATYFSIASKLNIGPKNASKLLNKGAVFRSGLLGLAVGAPLLVLGLIADVLISYDEISKVDNPVAHLYTLNSLYSDVNYGCHIVSQFPDLAEQVVRMGEVISSNDEDGVLLDHTTIFIHNDGELP